MTADLFRTQPWLTDWSGIDGIPKGMLGPREGSMLYTLTREYYRGYGEIVDAGAFLGSSAYCFARGLGSGPIDVRRSI